jgi:four helix bundle protein
MRAKIANGNRQTAMEGRLGWVKSLSGIGSLVYFKTKMFLQLNHQQFDIYKIARLFVKECYLTVKDFAVEEKFALIQLIRRAALSVHLNLAEGFSRKSQAERKRFFEISRGSLIEIDAALDIAEDLGYCQKEKLQSLGVSMSAVSACSAN